MHPEYQSKLATLFHEIHETYGFNFIVEAHSEYLVRRSQVIVARQKYNNDEKNVYGLGRSGFVGYLYCREGARKTP
jgi:predicted ATPase